jgi:hypothetical protein
VIDLRHPGDGKSNFCGRPDGLGRRFQSDKMEQDQKRRKSVLHTLSKE